MLANIIEDETVSHDKQLVWARCDQCSLFKLHNISSLIVTGYKLLQVIARRLNIHNRIPYDKT